MKYLVAILSGIVLGAFLGGLAGLGAGLLWVELAKPSNFEGAAGYAVVFVFTPAGAILGAIGFGIWFGVLVARSSRRRKRQA